MKDREKLLMRSMTVVLAIILLSVSSGAMSGEVTVMTRNLYLGADLSPAMMAADSDEFFAAVYEILGTIEYNSFPIRAKALAAEIAEKKPHLVGLQEIFNFTIDGTNAEPPFHDYLAELLSALDAQDLNYYVAAVVKNLDLAFPFGVNVIGVVDRDVILARGDVLTEVINLSSLCRVSEDGCNYSIVAAIPNPLDTEEAPLPPISIERGFVAVEAEWTPNKSITFVNTHLEVREMGPTGLVQAAQAYELTQVLSALNEEIPLIVVGDFNSDPRDQIRYSEPFGLIVPPYMQLNAGYTDLWTLRPGKPDGFTCCQDEDLLNRKSALYERVDLIFSSDEPRSVKINLVGDKISDRTTPSRLWPSDHAGVVGTITFK